MFRKLKDKIAEEVKSSPQRIQQLTQSVTEAIQSATSDESFFSIGDDDAPGSSPNPEPGFSNVSLSSYSTPNSGRLRRNSNSSVASDMSFLPRYESATNLYHLQSDLDISASEVEDNASSTSSQLGHLSKEQIYAAFQKSQMRYHKYRGRYTDIANHYKELERENGKMKSVLVETQDKALRRVAELREQCSLEQKAKAHLENALRVELDEKQYVIDTLKTKVNLLQASIKNGSDKNKPELLVNISDNSFSISDDPNEKSQDDNLEILTKDLKDARIEIENLNEKLQEMKANAIVYGSKETDLKKKILNLEELIRQKSQENMQVLERERENNLIIAQTKMELHTEIQNRDLEIENLKQDNEALKSDLEEYESTPKSGKMENLQSQNMKLIEKVEELTQKCNNYEIDLLKTEQLRSEIQNSNKIIESFKVKIQELEEKKVDEQEFEGIQEELRQLKDTLVIHEKTKEENIQLQQQLKQQQTDYEAKIEAYREDTKQHLLTLETKIKDKIKIEYEEKKEKMNLDFQEKLQQLSKTDNNVKETQLKLMQKEEEVLNLGTKLKSLGDTLEKQTQKYKDLETNHLELISESADVRNKLSSLEKENSELGNTIASTWREISEFERQQSALQNEKSSLQQQYESIKRENLKTIETKEALQCENQQLHIENAALKTENSSSTLQNDYVDLRNKNVNLQSDYVNLQNDYVNLQNKIVNLQEEFVKLQSENGALQNEKTNLASQIADLENDKANLASNNAKLISDNANLTKENAQLTKDNQQLQNNTADLSCKNAKLLSDYSDVYQEKTKLKSQVSDYEETCSKLRQNNASLKQRLIEATKTSETFQNEILSLQKNLTDNENQIQEKSQIKISSLQAEVAQTQADLVSSKQMLDDAQKLLEATQKAFENTKQNLNKKLKEQKSKFHDEIQNLNKEILGFKEKNEMIQVSIEEYKQKLTEYENGSLEKNTRLQDLTTNNAALSDEILEINTLLETTEAKNLNLSTNLETLQEELSQKTTEIQNIHEEKSDLNLKLQNALDENNNLKEQISRIQADSSKNVTDIVSNNEDLQKQLKAHEADLKVVSKENEKLKGQISRLQEVEAQLPNLLVMEDDYKKLQKEKVQLVNDVEGLQMKMHELNSENHRLCEEISRSQMQEQEILKENQGTKENHARTLEEISELKRRNNELSLDYNQISHENEGLLQELAEVKLKYETLDSEKTIWEESTRTSDSEKNEILSELQDYKTEIDKLRSDKSKTQEPQDMEKLESENKGLKVQLSRLEDHCEACEKQKKNLEGQLRELEHQYSEITHEKQLLQDEVQELKISPINMNNHTNNAEKLDNLDIIHAEKIYGLESEDDVRKLQEDHKKEIHNLNEKLVQYKSLDLTNRSSIQFYENELQKFKNKNEKLNRKLDETLVTLNHCTELSTSTETEYLRNILYNYMLGKEGVVLARVIAAVCKFDENQTEAILQREQQKQTLLGQLGFR